MAAKKKNMGELYVIVKKPFDGDSQLHQMSEELKKREEAEAWAKTALSAEAVFCTALLGPWMKKAVKEVVTLEPVTDDAAEETT